MRESNKLSGKDLVNVGIHTTMALIIFFVFRLLTSLSVIYPFLLFIRPSICGIPMMLYYTRIQKFGMLTITGVICSLFFFLTGCTWIGLAGWTLGGILADIVLKANQYKSFKVTFLSYVRFCLGMMGCPANLWIAGQSYWENIRSFIEGQYVETLRSMMPPWMMHAGFLILFVSGICGTSFDREMLKKHFEGAGIV